MAEVKGLDEKLQMKNFVIVSQEKVLQEKSENLQHVEKDLQSAQQQLSTKEEQVRLQVMETADTLLSAAFKPS